MTEQEFTDWFCKNYPKDTEIHDPMWHASRIYRRAQFAAPAAQGDRLTESVVNRLDDLGRSWMSEDGRDELDDLINDITSGRQFAHTVPAAQLAAPASEPEPNWKAFALAVLKDSRENIGCDVDGALVQDAATAHGLLNDVLVQEPCGDYCNCLEFGVFPTSCYQYSPAVLKALAAPQGAAHD